MTRQWILDRFRQFSDNDAIIDDETIFSYADILERINSWADIISREKIREGEIIGLEAGFTMDSFSLMIALVLNQNIILPMPVIVPMTGIGTMTGIDQMTDLNQHQKDEKYKTAEVSKVIKIKSDSYEIIKIDYPTVNPLLTRLINEHHPGLIIFSSGSTGEPKGILQNFDKLLEKYREAKSALRTLLFLQFDHIGGLNTILYTLMSGGCIIAAKSRQAVAICQLIERFRVELLPATPSFLNLLLLSEAYKDHDLSSLKMITYGTEAMQESVLRKLNSILPHVKFKQTYGLSEMGILNVKSKSPDTIWVKMDHGEYKIKIVENILFIKSNFAMEGYLNAANPFDEEGWFNTGDIVERDGDYIKILGRESEIINVGGEKIYPAAIEDILLQMPGIKDVNVKAEKNPIMGNIVVAEINLFEDENILDLKKRMKTFCKGKLNKNLIPAKLEIKDTNLFNNRFKRVKI